MAQIKPFEFCKTPLPRPCVLLGILGQRSLEANHALGIRVEIELKTYYDEKLISTQTECQVAEVQVLVRP